MPPRMHFCKVKLFKLFLCVVTLHIAITAPEEKPCESRPLNVLPRSRRCVSMRLRLLTCLFLARSSAFVLGPTPSLAPSRGSSYRTAQTSMGDVTVKFPGGRSATVPVGAPLSLAAYQAGCQVTYQCKAGTCASCEVLNGMQPVRCCQYKVKKPLFGSTISISSKPGSATRL